MTESHECLRGNRCAVAISRGLALFFGGFTLLNLLWDVRSPGLHGNLWWVDLRFFPHTIEQWLLGISAVCLIGYGCFPHPARWHRAITVVLLGMLTVATLANAVVYYRLRVQHVLYGGPPIPFSLLLTIVLLLIALPLLRRMAPGEGAHDRRIMAMTLLLGLVSFPLAQMVFFGNTDYRRPAEAIVVFGAKAYPDGTPSLALYDRVLTACQLYRQGYAPLLIFSGGPAEGTMHETEAMRRMAVGQGVPEQAILLDRDGLDTRATVRNTVPIFRARHIRRILTVSQFYHLPRIKMAYRRAGYDVYTVPARATRPLTGLPWYMTREVAALWAYYIR